MRVSLNSVHAVVGNVGMAGRKEFLLGNVPNRISHNAHLVDRQHARPDENGSPKLRPNPKTRGGLAPGSIEGALLGASLAHWASHCEGRRREA